MNITIIQDNSRVEVLGSNGFSIIEKLYKLAIDPNNTLTLEGNISSTHAYGYLVDYLNTNYGPDFIVNATNRYIYFEDPNIESLFASMNIGTNGKITEAQAVTINTERLFYHNTDIVNFDEFKYFTYYQSHNEQLFESCSNLESIDLTNVTTLEFQTLRGCTKLKYFNGKNREPYTLSLPNLTSITSRSAMSYLQLLQHVTSLGNITSLPNYTFEYCTGLLDIVIPNTVTTIGNGCFGHCTGLTTIDLTNITSLGNLTFRDCTSLSLYGGENSTVGELNMPNLTGTIKESCFRYNTSLTKITSLGSCGVLDKEAFRECSTLTTIDQSVLNKLTAIGNTAFYKCSALQLTTLSLPNLTSIGTLAFSECPGLLHIKNLGSITSLNSKWIDGGTFYACTGLLDVVLPETLTAIGLGEFTTCDNIRYIKILATSVPTYNLVDGRGDTFSYGRSFGEYYRNHDLTSEYLGCTYPIYVLDNLLEEYKVADGWKTIGPSSNGYDKTNLCERLKPMSQFATDFPDE